MNIKRPDFRPFVPAPGQSRIAGATARAHTQARLLNNVLPEHIDTPRQRYMAERIMKAENISLEEARARIVETVAAKRFGLPVEFGDACAFLCSVQAGFISGQNLELDGGSYRG